MDNHRVFALSMTVLWSIVFVNAMHNMVTGICMGLCMGMAFGLLDDPNDEEGTDKKGD